MCMWSEETLTEKKKTHDIKNFFKQSQMKNFFSTIKKLLYNKTWNISELYFSKISV